jgi:hypothetical protein
MTQLNLSDRHATRAQGSSSAEENGWSIRKQTLGALGALAMFAAAIAMGSCSRGSGKPAVMAQPTQPSALVPNPVAQATAPPAPQPVKAKPRKRRPATFSYVNREYGVSFRFPRQYKLKSGDQAQLSGGDSGPSPMNFVHPGGVTLAAVELPANSYPGTDFRFGFVNVSVNPGMTSEACAQFAFPESNAGGDPSSQDITAKVKIGAIEFSEVENSTAATMKQTDARYYHAFHHGACYEFALGIGTEDDGNEEGIAPLDRKPLFGKLEKILATVQLQTAAVPQTEAPAPSAAGTAPETPSNTPEQSAKGRKF